MGLGKDGEDTLSGPCVATERELIRGHGDGEFDLNSDVVIAPHHGSKNGSCLDFIKLVAPKWAIFTAGHDHGHPARIAVARYLDAGVPEGRIFRTDRGDNEGGGEWADEDTPENKSTDPIRDDDILITLKGDGSTPTVEYRDNH